MLELREVSYAWAAGQPVLRNFSLRVNAGEKLVLLGANGCGKSTLLKLINGLIFADTGDIIWRDEILSPGRLRQREFARQFRQACVLLFQHPEAMLFNPTVAEEIAYGPRQLGLADIDARVGHWATELGLTALLDLAPFSLSGGEKQKVALACLLALEPELLLLDEPSASLDPATVGWLIDTLLQSDKTVIVSTHNLSMAAELGSRCVVLGHGGEILFDGPARMALSGTELLEKAGLAHRHRHRHQGGLMHSHPHAHDWQE